MTPGSDDSASGYRSRVRFTAGAGVRAVRRFLGGQPWGARRPLWAVIWLGFILFPLIDAVSGSGSTLGHVLTIAGAAVFTGTYVGLVVMWRKRASHEFPIVIFGVMVAVAIALTISDNSNWAFLFTYCAAVTAVFSSSIGGWTGVIICAALAAGCSLVGGASTGDALTFTVTALGIGMLMVLMRDLRIRNEELVAARAELAQTAVTQERERFARDLHDLLGHSLSLIALKAELAGRLLPDRPEQAATEVGEVEQVARQALGEVRLAVSGYRQPTLDGELAGARMALSAAGIRADVDAPKVTLAPDVEAVLAWTVREGATNVIRHSKASACTIRVVAGLVEASVQVIDDGGRGGSPLRSVDPGDREAPFDDDSARPAGHGLAGLRERAQAIGGRFEAGPLPDGGFRVIVSVPVSGRPAGGPPAPAPVPPASDGTDQARADRAPPASEQTDQARADSALPARR